MINLTERMGVSFGGSMKANLGMQRVSNLVEEVK